MELADINAEYAGELDYIVLYLILGVWEYSHPKTEVVTLVLVLSALIC